MAENLRGLKPAEKVLAKSVFENTLPYDRILIGDELGIGGCPWMEVEGWLENDAYIIHIGWYGYRDATSYVLLQHDNDHCRNTFIHELTHVWQAYNETKWVFTRSASRAVCHAIPNFGISVINEFATMKDIINNQIIKKIDMYEYEAGSEWDDYNVEQQAKIVEHWFSSGMSVESELYPYIRDKIRKGI